MGGGYGKDLPLDGHGKKMPMGVPLSLELGETELIGAKYIHAFQRLRDSYVKILRAPAKTDSRFKTPHS